MARCREIDSQNATNNDADIGLLSFITWITGPTFFNEMLGLKENKDPAPLQRHSKINDLKGII
jgi:hypothetical protein